MKSFLPGTRLLTMIATTRNNVTPVMRTKNLVTVMAFGFMALYRRCFLHFFQHYEKIEAKDYYSLIWYCVLPLLKANYPENNYVFIQDSTPCHKATQVQNFSANSFAKFLPTFWPSCSPHLNVLDYSVWIVVDAETCKTPHSSVEALKQSIMTTWKNMPEDYLVKSCKALCGGSDWCRRRTLRIVTIPTFLNDICLKNICRFCLSVAMLVLFPSLIILNSDSAPCRNKSSKATEW